VRRICAIAVETNHLYKQRPNKDEFGRQPAHSVPVDPFP
jgi:hypothetical protein